MCKFHNRRGLWRWCSAVITEVFKNTMAFWLNGAEFSLNSVISANSGNLINHWSMTWAACRVPVSHMCLAGALVAFWSLTQEVAGSGYHWICGIHWKHLGKTPLLKVEGMTSGQKGRENTRCVFVSLIKLFSRLCCKKRRNAKKNCFHFLNYFLVWYKFWISSIA